MGRLGGSSEGSMLGLYFGQCFAATLQNKCLSDRQVCSGLQVACHMKKPIIYFIKFLNRF